MLKTLGLIVAALIGLYLVSCAQRGGGAGAIDGPKARTLVADGARLVDVRTPQEFGGGHIDGAKNIPVQELAGQLSKLEPKDKPVVVYCRSGARSAKAASMLRDAGFTEVYDLGGIGNW